MLRKTITIEKSPEFNCLYYPNHDKVAIHIENLLFITILPFVDITVGVYFLKTEKHSHFCRHCYPFRTYRTIQIWTVYGMILLLLHKLYTQNERDLILQMYLFYYLIQTPNFEYSLHIFYYSIRRTSSLHYIHKLNRLR